MSVKNILLRFYRVFIAQFGIDPRKTIRSLEGLPRYVRVFFRFRSGYTGRLEFVPCLHDWSEEGETTKVEYFWQNLFLPRMKASEAC